MSFSRTSRMTLFILGFSLLGVSLLHLGTHRVSAANIHIAATAPDNCVLDSSRVRFTPYIINPNGQLREANNPTYAHSFPSADGSITYRMEDSNIDNDYQDVELIVNGKDPNAVKVTVRVVRALWHHKVGLRTYYDSTLIDDRILWTDSHTAIGQTKTFSIRDAELFSYYCSVPPSTTGETEPDESAPIVGGQCIDFDCNAAGLYMYIVNPDGSERHTQSIYAQTHRKGPRQFDIYYDDSGSDFDYNDVMLGIDARNCRAMKVSVLNVLASWHHQIRARIIYNNVVLNDILIWPDSHQAVGETAQYDILNYIPACMAN